MQEQVDIFGWMFQQGAIGVIAVIAMIVAIFLYRRVENLWEKIQNLMAEHTQDVRDLQDEKIAMQEGYIEEQKAVRTEIAEIANQANLALKTFSDVLNEVKQDIRGR